MVDYADQARREALARLREPFPEDVMGLKPIYVGLSEHNEEGRARIPDSAFHECPTCGGFHALPAKHVPYVGHARVTERLLEVDPYWSWEPLGTTCEGNPLITGGSLWIRLTVCGMTRIGVGNAENWTGPDAHKEMVSDAIRNAAMRFGAALNLWYAADGEVTYPPEPPEDAPREPFKARLRANPTKAQRRIAAKLQAIADAGFDAADAAEELQEAFGRPYWEMTSPMVDKALDALYAEYGDVGEQSEVIAV